MLHLITKHAKLIFVWGAIVALVTGIVSALIPPEYSAESQILIISRDRVGVDPFTQVKLVERLGDNLVQVIQTEDFFSKVLEVANPSFDKTRWQNLEPLKLRRAWRQNVRSEMIEGTSLLKITVYSKNKSDALQFSAAVTQTLVSHGWEYGGVDATIKIVNNPIVSRFPARPNIPANVIIGFIAGAGLAMLWLMRYKRHLWGVA